MSEKAMTMCTGAFVDELTRSGVGHVVISPGSRSTPIALFMAAHPKMKVWMNIDERSASFFALGIAKACREPVALLCTSGTAAANYFPAVVEAHEARVPLIILTADRPHELRGVGAPQAINQINLYGTYVKWFTEMALPDASERMLRYVRTTASRAVAVASTGPQGPVHLNFPFREPLTPSLAIPVITAASRQGNKPYVEVSPGRIHPERDLIERLAADLRVIERGLIVCGPQDDPDFPQTVVDLAQYLNFPIVADPLSQVRNGSHTKQLVIDGYDAFLRDNAMAEQSAPDIVIRFGAMPVSKALTLYLSRHDCEHIVVDGGGSWREPTQSATHMVYADSVLFCEELIQVIAGNKASSRTDWLDHWIEINELTQAEIKKQTECDELFEGSVFRELAHCLPSDAILFVGNSMPVRDLDTFFMNSDIPIRTMCNRGANGIDGVVSTALGASTNGRPLVLVIGDLSFFHDLNGLLAAKMYGLNVTIIVMNNDGGGIFSFLPQADLTEHFEMLFGTPTGLDFQSATEMFGGAFTRVTDWQQFRMEVANGIEMGGLTVVEVPTERKRNVAKHRAIWQAVSDKVSSRGKS